MTFLLHTSIVEYDKLKKERERQQEEQKAEQLEKLQHDLGEGHSVPIATHVDGAQTSKPQGLPNISLGVGLDSDDDGDDDEDMEDERKNEDEQKEAESFKRFLNREKKRKETNEQTGETG